MAGELRFRFLSLSSFYYYDLFLVRSMLSNNSLLFLFIFYFFCPVTLTEEALSLPGSEDLEFPLPSRCSRGGQLRFWP